MRGMRIAKGRRFYRTELELWHLRLGIGGWRGSACSSQGLNSFFSLGRGGGVMCGWIRADRGHFSDTLCARNRIPISL